MNMPKIKEIIHFSFSKYFQNKWFILLNIISLISFIVIINRTSFENVLPSNNEDETFTIEMIDDSNLVYNTFSEYFKNNEDYEIKKLSSNDYNPDDIKENMGVIEIIPSEEEFFTTKFTSLEGIEYTIYSDIFSKLLEIRNTELANKFNISLDDLNIVRSELKVERIMLDVNNDDSGYKEVAKAVLTMIIYIVGSSLFIKIAMEISQEKLSKSSEYILTCVSAKEYLFSKVVANILAFVFQTFLFGCYFLIAMLLKQLIIGVAPVTATMSSLYSDFSLDIDATYIITAIVFNLMTFIIFSFIQATIASKTSSSNEAGNSTTIIIIFLASLSLITDLVIDSFTKVSPIVYALSCLPVFSGFFIPAIALVGQSNIIQIIIAFILHIILIPFTFKICVKIFKNGILDYSKVKPTQPVLESPEKLVAKKSLKNVGFSLGIGITIYYIFQQIIPLLFTLFVSSVENLCTKLNIDFDLSIYNSINMAVTQFVSIGLAYLFLRLYSEKSSANTEPNKISIKKSFKIICIGFFLTLVVQNVVSAFYDIIDLNYDYLKDTDISISANDSILQITLTFLYVAIAPAICEELFFRKGIMDVSKKYGLKFSILLSAFLFGLLHLNLMQGINAFILGLLFAIIYAYTGNIKYTIILHLFNNGLGCLEMLASSYSEIGNDTLLYVINPIVLIISILGFIYFIKLLLNKKFISNFQKYNILLLNYSKITQKYIYILYDFTFDVTLVFLFIAFIVTELRLSA